jgi:hypothetical protein
MFDYVRPRDILIVVSLDRGVSLDRLDRSLEDLIGIVGRLKLQEVGFQGSVSERRSLLSLWCGYGTG